MRTRGKQPDVPVPERPWNEIVPGLWMGGHEFRGRSGRLELAVVRDEFDLVQSLLRLPGYGPIRVWSTMCGRFRTVRWTGTQLAGVMRLARAVNEALDSGRRVLVRCYHGYNRSGLVVAHALVQLGRSPDEAIQLIRARRSAWALHNELFVDYLRAGLHTVRLLEELAE